MRDELDRDLHDWFRRSAEPLPEQPFSQTVLERVWRRELTLRLQRYAALLVAAFSIWLLLPEIRATASALTIADAGPVQWSLLAGAVLFAYALALRRARR